MHIFSGGSKLQIARSQLSDSGTYECVASNVEGKARKSYHLTVHSEYSTESHVRVGSGVMGSSAGKLLKPLRGLSLHIFTLRPVTVSQSLPVSPAPSSPARWGSS